MTIAHAGVEAATGQQVELFLGFADAYSGLIYTYGTGLAGFRFDNDTYVYALNQGLVQQQQLTGDRWVTPRTNLTLTDYEIRWLEVSSFSTLANLTQSNSTGWTEGTWLDLATDRQVHYTGIASTPYGYPQQTYVVDELGALVNLRIEIRFGDGTPDARNTLTSPYGGDAHAAFGTYTVNIGAPY